MNKREKELYGKKQWKHTNPIETLNKALEDINFGKNGVLLSIGANDYETEKAVSKSFKNNELIIATDVRGYNADMLVNSHLLVLKDKIDAELFTIDDFNKFIGNNNYTNRQRNPYVRDMGQSVYAYTFGAPMTIYNNSDEPGYTKTGYSAINDCIFNIVNEEDTYAYIMPQELGFSRYGMTCFGGGSKLMGNTYIWSNT